MELVLCLGLFIPFISFLLLTASSSVISRKMTGIIGSSSIFLSFLSFSYLLFLFQTIGVEPFDYTLFQWIHFSRINADFTLHLDTLSLLMALIITGVGFLIHVYSIGYIEHDEDYARYFACLNFFVFAMLLLVLAGDLLLLFVGWEGVGLASYLLIGYWYHRPQAANAATKAFVVNRMGDFGFLVGLLLTFTLFSTTNITEVLKRAELDFATGASLMTLLTLLFFIGAIGKSAQIPLHTWLPDAMEGPTPVSALIHAATMVTAGVYLVVRLHPLYLLAPITLQIVGLVGIITALYASLSALGQTDLKRVLAYSTVSQLGLMFLACGVGAFYAAMFHLTMHAFMKALLFLSAGNVVHMMSGTTDMDKMGGLSKRLPVTVWLFLIGTLAMSGIPPLAAFFSKDLILEETFLTGYKVWFYLALVTSILTAFYLTRAFCLTFLGVSPLDEKILKRVKEAPRVMLSPVVLLAFLSIVGGFLGPLFLESFLDESGVNLAAETASQGIGFSFVTSLSIVGAFIGLFASYFLYTQFKKRLGPTLTILKNAFYVDEIYQWVFVNPLKAFSHLVSWVFEPRFFDGSLRLITKSANNVASLFQEVQSGEIRSYVAWMVVGAFVLIMLMVI